MLSVSRSEERAEEGGGHHEDAVDDVVGGDGVGAEFVAAGGLQPGVEGDGEEAAEEAGWRPCRG